MATTGGAWAGFKLGTAGGAGLRTLFFAGLGTGVGAVIGGAVGGIGGAFFGHDVYDKRVAPEVRARVIGEKFRDGN